MLSDQLMLQHRHSGETFQQPAPGQDPASGVFNLNVMMGLGPVIPNERHPVSSLMINAA
jgi:hypothetical protein